MQSRRGIDHLVLCVRDLDAAAEFYEALGFRLTPRGEHPWGTSNRLVQLDGCFLEILAAARPEEIAEQAAGQFNFGAFCRDFLVRREGLAMLVFEGHDARADRAEFAGKGLETYEPFDFERQAKLPDGAEVTVGFSLAFVTHPQMPEAAFFTCQQHAPQYFWKPDYQSHANGATGVAEVVMVADEPGRFGGFFGALQDEDAVRSQPGRLHVATARGQVSIIDRVAAADRFPDVPADAWPEGASFAGYAVSVPKLDMVRSRLCTAERAFHDFGDRVQIAPAHALGVAIEFVEA